MRLGIIGWLLSELEKKWRTQFPVYVDMMALLLDVTIFVLVFSLIELVLF